MRIALLVVCNMLDWLEKKPFYTQNSFLNYLGNSKAQSNEEANNLSYCDTSTHDVGDAALCIQVYQFCEFFGMLCHLFCGLSPNH